MSFIIKIKRECGYGRTRYVMDASGTMSLRAAEALRLATLDEAKANPYSRMVNAEIVDLDKPARKGKAA